MGQYLGHIYGMLRGPCTLGSSSSCCCSSSLPWLGPAAFWLQSEMCKHGIQNPGGVCGTLKAQLLSKGSSSGSSADSQIAQGLAQEEGKGGSWLSSVDEQNPFLPPIHEIQQLNRSHFKSKLRQRRQIWILAPSQTDFSLGYVDPVGSS